MTNYSERLINQTHYIFICPVCGEKFTNKSRSAVYCSRSCTMRRRMAHLKNPEPNCIGKTKVQVICRKKIETKEELEAKEGLDIYKKLSNDFDQRKPKVCPMTCPNYGKKDANGDLICGKVQPEHVTSGVRWIMKPTKECNWKWN